MAIAVSHTFTTAIADDAAAQAAGEVLPSHWNAAHTLSGFGTGVATALAVNVGSAGAPVLFNGALGTPSSGTLTNCTGLPAAGVTGTAAVLGANTFTALQTITQASANAGILASTGYSLTGSNTVSAIDIAGTWNSSGQTDFFALRLTDTARHASSKFVNFYAGASGTTSEWSLDRSGNTLQAGSVATSSTGSASTCAVSIGSGTNCGFYRVTNYLEFVSAGTNVLQLAYISSGFADWKNDIVMSWCTGDPSATARDIGLARSSAGLLEVCNGTAGTLRDLKYRNVVGQSGYTEMVEMTAPSAGAANTARIYAEDSGGKTRLMVIFPSGAAQQIAIEP